MHPFEETVSIVGPIVAAIILLTIFFRFLNWLGSRSTGSASRFAFRGILDENTRATVHLSNGRTFEGVRMVGFTDSGSTKGAFPWELQGMVILQEPDGRKVLVRAKMIRMIEIPPNEG